MKKLSLCFLFFVLFVAFATLANAVEMWTQFANYECTTAISRDGDNLWVGASGAIIRYNVVSGDKVIFNNANTPIPYCTVTDIAITSDRVKWFATDKGLIKYDDYNWTVYDTVPQGYQDGFTCMLADNLDNIWLGSYNAGLYKFNGSVWMNYTTANSALPFNQVTALGMDSAQYVWIATYGSGGSKLTKIDRPAWIVMNNSNTTFYTNYISAIDFSSTGTMWLGQQCCGVTSFDGTTWAHYGPYNYQLPNSYIDDLMVDSNDTVWAVLDDYYIASFEGETWEVVTLTSFGLPVTIHADDTGDVWAGFSGGLFQKQGSQWPVISFSNCNDVPMYRPADISFSEQGDLWAMNHYGLLHFSQDTWDDVTFSELSLPANNIYTTAEMTIDHEDNIWFGAKLTTSDDQLIKYDGESVISFNSGNSSLPVGYLRGITVAPNGNIWIGKNTGIFCYNGVNWTSYYEGVVPGYSGYMIDIACDSDGKVYVLTQEELYIYNGITWTFVDLPTNYANDLFIDGLDRVWISGENIVLKYANSALTYRTPTNTPAMPAGDFTAVAVDAHGYIWLGSDTGDLYKTDYTSWEHYDSDNSGLTSWSIDDLRFDAEGHLWVASPYAMCKMDPHPVEIEDPVETLIPDINLSTYPNPFKTKTDITYQLNNDSQITISIYNLKGQLTRRLYTGYKSSGINSVQWDGSNEKGISCPDGIYLIRVTADGVSATRKILRQK